MHLGITQGGTRSNALYSIGALFKNPFGKHIPDLYVPSYHLGIHKMNHKAQLLNQFRRAW